MTYGGSQFALLVLIYASVGQQVGWHQLQNQTQSQIPWREGQKGKGREREADGVARVRVSQYSMNRDWPEPIQAELRAEIESLWLTFTTRSIPEHGSS